MSRDTTFIVALLALVLAKLSDGAWQTSWSVISVVFVAACFADWITERYQRRKLREGS